MACDRLALGLNASRVPVATFAQRAPREAARPLAADQRRPGLVQHQPVQAGCQAVPPLLRHEPHRAYVRHPRGAAPGAAPRAGMYRQGYRYKKAGVGLLDLTHGNQHQADLFSQVDPRSKVLMVLDRANARFGRGSLGLASSAWRSSKG